MIERTESRTKIDAIHLRRVVDNFIRSSADLQIALKDI